jgi:hypothetical protein
MLSRTASALYWIGRYVERAEFTATSRPPKPASRQRANR